MLALSRTIGSKPNKDRNKEMKQEMKPMTKKFYAANDGKCLLQVVTELGNNNISIGLSDNVLNWKTIHLSAEQSAAFKKFMRDYDI